MGIRIGEDEAGASNYVTKTAADVIYVNQAGDTMTGDLDLNSNNLKHAKLEDCLVLADPVEDFHLVNKKYLATQFPKVIPLLIDTTVNKKQARLIITGIDLGVVLQNTNQVILVFNYHPFVQKIDKSVTEALGTNNKVTLTISLLNSTTIGRFILHGSIMIKSASGNLLSGGTTSIIASEAELATRQKLKAETDLRDLARRQWAASYTINEGSWDEQAYPLSTLGGYIPSAGIDPPLRETSAQNQLIQKLEAELVNYN